MTYSVIFTAPNFQKSLDMLNKEKSKLFNYSFINLITFNNLIKTKMQFLIVIKNRLFYVKDSKTKEFRIFVKWSQI